MSHHTRLIRHPAYLPQTESSRVDMLGPTPLPTSSRTFEVERKQTGWVCSFIDKGVEVGQGFFGHTDDDYLAAYDLGMEWTA